VPTTRRSTDLRRIAALALTVAATLAACAPGAVQLAERDFLSVSVTENGAPRALVAGTRIRLGFRASEFGAQAGCNSMGGTYRVDGGRLIVEAVGMTEMGCDEPRHAQDEWLSTFLGSGPQVRLVGNDLTLEGDGIVIRMLDTEVADPDLNLVGPTWTVESLITGDAVASVPEGATATLVFKADGTVEVSPGCNRGSGTWTLQGGGIEITGIGLTKMACEGPQGQLEAFVLQVLESGGLQSTIDASVLTLQGAGTGLQLRGA
jgi:heat shock protein HslJ